jgi:hypothetical protein
VYGREVEDKEFTFGVSGKLIRNVLVMYDRETNSYWSQLLGEAVDGEMVGAKLTFLPSWFMTWEEWKKLHPDTVAMDKNGRRGSRDTYDSYYASDSAGVIGRSNSDDRLGTKEFVIGVELEDASVAYPFSVLSREPLINDSVAGKDLLVAFDRQGGAGVVFARTVDGRSLTFSQNEDQATITDIETGSTWDKMIGKAVSGQLKGTELERVKSVASFWFGWVDFHPDTIIYGIDQENSG